MIVVLERVKSYFEKSFGKKTLVVRTEAESRKMKELLFGLGAEIVSDRDVVTLDYLLTQKYVQEDGVRILDDHLFSYLQEDVAPRVMLDRLKLVKNFPDPFLEEGLWGILLDFFAEQEGGRDQYKKLQEASEIIKKAFQKKEIPRSFIALGINKFINSEEHVLLDTLLSDLPEDFQFAYAGEVLELSEDRIEEREQLDLYKSLQLKDCRFNYLNFHSQVEEVRFILKTLAENDDQILFLYPPNSGYETLFFLYQREFFKEQKFFFKKGERTHIQRVIKSLQKRNSFFESAYNQGNYNNNKVSIKERENSKVTLEEILNEFEGEFTEYDLNLISPLVNQIPDDCKRELSVWIEILLEIDLKRRRQDKKIISELPVEDYSYMAVDKVEDLYVLGWGEHLFSRQGERIFPTTILSAMERDLGLNFKTLNKSAASDLLKNPLILNSEVKKHILYSEKNLSGSSVKPGVFKILGDQESEASAVSRLKLSKEAHEDTKRLDYKEKRLSASSLKLYDECSYKFYLEKVIGLDFEDEEDYFLSPKEEGILIHEALESLGDQKIDKKTFTEKLKEKIMSQDEELNSFRGETLAFFVDKIWGILESENKFLSTKEIEKIDKEKFFSFSLDLENKEFTPKKEDSYTVTGLIDRIDNGSEGAFLYDYKRADSGSISLSRYTGKQLSPQLFLYCLAVDHGFLIEAKKLLGFQYINIKEYKRSKGFVFKDSGEGLAKEIPHGSLVSEDKYDEKMTLFLEKFWNVVEKISSNHFVEEPNPAYSGACENCRWVGVCKKSETFQ